MSPDYDFTGDGNNTDLPSEAFRTAIMLNRVVDVDAIIASDSTLTANGVIAASDVIEIIDVPNGFIFTNSFIRSLEAEGAALTADVGIAGSNEIFSNYSLNQALGVIDVMSATATWGNHNKNGVEFEAADTIDFKFDHETDNGSWHVFITGWMLIDF